MDEKTKEALGEALKMLVDSLQGGKDFVIEQSPLLVQEIVNLGRVEGTAILVGSVIGVILVCFLTWLRYGGGKLEKRMKEANCIESIEPIPLIFAVIGFVVLVIVFGVNVGWTLEAWFAPRLYVLHQIKDML